MTHDQQYVRLDEHGVYRVGAGNVMLDSVVAAWEQGHSPETIRSQYPSLTLEEVYGSITWCLSHPAEVVDYMNRQSATWAQWKGRAKSRPSALVERLRAARVSSARDAHT